jgi:membrane protein implicated in regulation of membrane protease activity
MLTYNGLGTVYFAWLALGGTWAGPLLWPVVALHAILAALLARAWVQARKPDSPDETTKP